MVQAKDEQLQSSPKHGGLWPVLRPLILRLHFYAGVFIAPFILVAAVSGLLYVWMPQVEEAVYDEQLHVEAGGEQLPLHEQVRIAREEVPGAEPDAARPGPGPEDSTRVLFELPELDESYRMAVFVNPYDGEVLGTVESYGTDGALPVRSWVDQLHRNLHLGDVGSLYSELAASWLWVVVLGGAALWLGRRRSLTKNLRRTLVPGAGTAAGRGRRISLHAATGLWLLVGLLFLSATGLTWSQYAGSGITDLRERLAWTTPAVAPAEPVEAPGVDVGPDAVLAAAEESGLGGRMEISFPDDESPSYVVSEIGKQWPSSADSVAVAPDTGAVTDTVRFDDYPLAAKFSRWGIDAHMGLLFGIPNQLLLTAVGGGLVGVIALGYRMWWSRRPTRAGTWAMGRPYERGSLRALPHWLKGLVVVVLAVIGWAVPLMGVSLLAFLAVDVAVGAWKRRRGDRDGAPRAAPDEAPEPVAATGPDRG